MEVLDAGEDCVDVSMSTQPNKKNAKPKAQPKAKPKAKPKAQPKAKPKAKQKSKPKAMTPTTQPRKRKKSDSDSLKKRKIKRQSLLNFPLTPMQQSSSSSIQTHNPVAPSETDKASAHLTFEVSPKTLMASTTKRVFAAPHLTQDSPYQFVLYDSIKALRELCSTVGAILTDVTLRIRFDKRRGQWFVFMITENQVTGSILKVMYDPQFLRVHPAVPKDSVIKVSLSLSDLQRRVQEKFIGDRKSINVQLRLPRQSQQDNHISKDSISAAASSASASSVVFGPEIEVVFPSKSTYRTRTQPQILMNEERIEDMCFEYDTLFMLNTKVVLSELGYGSSVMHSDTVTIQRKCRRRQSSVEGNTDETIDMFLTLKQTNATGETTECVFAAPVHTIDPNNNSDAQIENSKSDLVRRTCSDLGVSAAQSTSVIFDCTETPASEMSRIRVSELEPVGLPQKFHTNMLLNFLLTVKTPTFFLLMLEETKKSNIEPPPPCVILQNSVWARYMLLQRSVDDVKNNTCDAL